MSDLSKVGITGQCELSSIGVGLNSSHLEEQLLTMESSSALKIELFKLFFGPLCNILFFLEPIELKDTLGVPWSLWVPRLSWMNLMGDIDICCSVCFER